MMRRLVKVILLIWVAGWFALVSTGKSQEFRYGIETGVAAGAEGSLPFWLHANQFHRYDQHSTNLNSRLFGRYSVSFNNGLSVDGSGDVVLRAAGDAGWHTEQLYLRGSYSGFQLYAGRKREYYGLGNPDLSLGSMDWSPNVRPMPKISFSTEGFQPVPYTERYVHFDFNYSHGLFDDDRFNDGVHLHQKHLYLRVGDTDHQINAIGGIVHFNQLFGESEERGELPSGLANYINGVLSRGQAGTDSRYRVGNSVGIYDFGLLLRFRGFDILAYRQFYLEDTPNANFAAPWDGMWGMNMVLDSEGESLISELLYEHVYTKDQLTNNPDREGLTANYYNHSRYRSGWTYQGRVIGSPLFYTEEKYIGVVNNELVAHHLGISGKAGGIAYRNLFTYSSNYGAQRVYEENGVNRVNLNTPRKDQFSAMAELQIPLTADLKLNVILAADIGELYPGNPGALVSLIWSGS